MARVLVGLSGGVDSAVAALRLKQQGHDVVGAFMKNWINQEQIAGNCPWEEDLESARSVAAMLDIPFRVVTLIDLYRTRVVDYLLEGYRSGITPNPDVMCNREIKFGAFLDRARAEGFDFVATGHYARRRDVGSVVHLLEGVDKSKDQSYFLALLQQSQLQHALFPIGDLLKAEVRSLAAEAGLPNATRRDSQGICFIGQVRIGDFLRAFVEDSPGPIIDLHGRQLGVHQGLHFYTLGQRQGLRVASNTLNKAYVVVEKRPDTNALVVAFDEPSTPGLYARSARLGTVSFTIAPLDTRRDLLARPRYRAAAVGATYEPRSDGTAHITFHTPQRALTPGQICALYDGEELLGGAVFTQVDPIL